MTRRRGWDRDGGGGTAGEKGPVLGSDDDHEEQGQGVGRGQSSDTCPPLGSRSALFPGLVHTDGAPSH